MANCPKCDAHIIDGAASCEYCGAILRPKKKLSIICLVGFILGLLSALSVVIVTLSWINATGGSNIEEEAVVMVVVSIIAAVLLLLSIIISIIGLVNAKKNNKSGKALAVIGIVLSCIVLVVFVLYFLLVGLIISCVNGLSDKKFSEDPVRYGDYAVVYNDKKTEAAVATYFWDGDPAHNTIDLTTLTPDGVRITSIGTDSKIAPRRFSIEIADPDKDFYKSVGYQNSDAANTSWIPTEDSVADFGIHEGTVVNFEEVVFTIRMNEKIDNVVARQNNLSLATINDDGSITFYRYYYYFDCSPDNPNYYSKDGVLYDWYSNQDMFYQHPYKPKLTE